ncbi:MAG: HNH endonuclease [Acidobacteriota bacterium]|nr:HNH endonuclease [Acidobacteriota bacterium]
MATLHIVQGGIDNGDKDWLVRAANRGIDAPIWTVPKSVIPGDEVVISILDYGFFAIAKVKSFPEPREDWDNRYGASLTAIKLIEPAIPISIVRQKIPDFAWAKYPRSITTPDTKTASKIKKLINTHQRTGILDLDDDAFAKLQPDELRKIALLKARKSLTPKEQKSVYRVRSQAIKLYVLKRSGGVCEGCGEKAPFRRDDGSGYLEPHHTTRVADDGPDHPGYVIALCPNCHRRAHYSMDRKAFNNRLVKKLSRLEGKNVKS